MNESRRNLLQAAQIVKEEFYRLKNDPNLQADAFALVTAISLAMVTTPFLAEAVAKMAEMGLRRDPESVGNEPLLACIVPTRLPQTTPGYLVYAVDFERKNACAQSVASSPLDVRPFWFHSEALAVRYAERVLKSVVVEVHRGNSPDELSAALAWNDLVTPDGSKELREPLTRDYFQAPASPPGQGIILWKPLFAPRGIEIGVETGSHQLSTIDPPMVFPDFQAASATVRRQSGTRSNISPFSHMPHDLAHQLQPAPSLGVESPTFGANVYVRTPPSTRSGHPSANRWGFPDRPLVLMAGQLGHHGTSVRIPRGCLRGVPQATNASSV